MKAIVKVIVVVAILNAVGRVGLAVWNYYELRDSAQETVTFGAHEQPSQLQSRILKKAAELYLPIKAEEVSVERLGLKTAARASYTQSIEVFPRYQYPFTFSFNVESISMAGLR
jgi:hypothetical protein